MSGMSARVDGATDLAAALSTAVDRLDLTEAHDEASSLIADRARLEAPRRTGYLAGTVTQAAAPGIGSVIVTADYAVPVHAANPFLTRAVGQVVDRVVAVYDDQLADIVRTIQ